MNQGVLCKYALLGRDVPLIISMRRYCTISQNSRLRTSAAKQKEIRGKVTHKQCLSTPSIRALYHPTHSLIIASLHSVKMLADKCFVRTMHSALSEPIRSIFWRKQRGFKSGPTNNELFNPKRIQNSGPHGISRKCTKDFLLGRSGIPTTAFNRERTSYSWRCPRTPKTVGMGRGRGWS